MSDKVDYLGDDVESHPLALPYFKCHRVVLETFCKANLSARAQRVYLYLCHNSLIHHGRSHKLSVSEVAAYFDVSERTIYRAFREIEDSGLASIREHRDIVFNLPAMVIAQIEAKQLAVSSKVKAREEAFEGQVRAAILDVESTLGRTLTMRETENFTRIMMQRLLLSEDADK